MSFDLKAFIKSGRIHEEDSSNLRDLGINDFRSLFNKMPSDLQTRVNNLRNSGQRADKHPEGNVLKHTITVVNRSISDDDIDIALAAMFHDIGKDETEGIHPKKGHITHFGHEKVSAQLVKDYKDFIESVGGNVANVFYIVKNHMRYKQLSNMRPEKQQKLKSFRAFDKLGNFSKHDRGGLDEAEKLNMTIPNDIRKIHDAFRKSGKKLYVVGGAVRDAILGQSPKDFDLATDAKPDEVLQIAQDAGLSTNEIGQGKNFGVVIVDGNEIATFRKDIGKGRRPDSVDYTDIQGDVQRRDFTVNALFYDIDKREVVDLVGGLEDLKNNKIRTVGKSEDRFSEDPLRKLRAIRFQTRMGADIDQDTLNALKADPSLEGVSAERIKDEFFKSIKTSKDVKAFMELSDEIGFTKSILPGLNISSDYPDENDPILFLSHVLKDNSLADLKSELGKLRYSNDEIKDILFLVALSKFKPQNIVNVKKLQKAANVSDEDVMKFGEMIGEDFSKFLDFNLSVKGNDAPDNIDKREIGNWIANKEKENYVR